MIITDVKAIYPRWNRRPTRQWQSHFWQIVVRIETDLGVMGLGYGGGGEPGVQVINRHLKRFLIGRRIESVEDIQGAWHALYRAALPYGRMGLAQMALGGVDLALWDLLGQVEGVPVYELLGGLRRARIRAYATGRDFALFRDLGYTATKMSHNWRDETDYDTAVEQAERARAALGPEALLLVDCYMSWDAEVTRVMARLLAPCRPYWFEDVLTPDEPEAMADLRPSLHPIKLAGGEHEFSYRGYVELARLGALDLWQPDVTWCGGLTAALRIVALAERHGIPVVPHRGGEIWGLHLIAATGCVNLAETMPAGWAEGMPQLWLDEPRAHEGYLRLSDRPGFGVQLNHDML